MNDITAAAQARLLSRLSVVKRTGGTSA